MLWIMSGTFKSDSLNKVSCIRFNAPVDFTELPIDDIKMLKGWQSIQNISFGHHMLHVFEKHLLLIIIYCTVFTSDTHTGVNVRTKVKHTYTWQIVVFMKIIILSQWQSPIVLIYFHHKIDLSICHNDSPVTRIYFHRKTGSFQNMYQLGKTVHFEAFESLRNI